MKILVVCQHFYPENFRINDICYELAKKGNDVTVLTGLPNYPLGKVLKDYKYRKNRSQIVNDVKIIRCSLIGRGKSKLRLLLNYMWFAFFGSIKAFFLKDEFDIVYVYQLSPITMTIPAIIVKKIKKIPLVIHVLDQWPVSVITGGVSKKSFIYKFLTRLSVDCYNYADLITCSSFSFRDYFVNELNLSEEKKFLYLPSYAEDDYKNIKMDDNSTFDLVFAGNVGPAVNVESIIEAANILKDNKNIVFHIVGDGLSRKNCENLAKKYCLTNVIFYGYHDVSEMPKYYKKADAFLITMIDNEVVNSTLPAKLQSYMVCGRPIIGAINGEVSRVVNDADCGLCCDALDFHGLAKLILKASKSKKLDRWGKNAYNYYLKFFSKEKCIEDLEEVLNETCNMKINSYSSNIEKFIKYGFVSGLSMVLDLLLFTIFNKYVVGNFFNTNVILLSTIFARIISSFFNYLCNKNITFKTNNRTSFFRYYLLCIIQVFVSGFLVQIIYPKLGINVTLLKFFVDLLIFIVNFIVQKLWVFKSEVKK